MNALHLTLGLAFLNVALSAPAADPPVAANGLSCKLSVPSTTPGKDHEIEGQLIVTNVSKGPLSLCTLNGGTWGHGPGKTTKVITPEFFKSDGPSREQLAQSRKILQPGESHALSFVVFDMGDDEIVKLTVTYAVSDAFGKELNVWRGQISATQDLKITRSPEAKAR